MKIKKYLQNAIAKFIFDEPLDSIKLSLNVAHMLSVKPEDTTTTTTTEDEPREDVVQTLHDHEKRISDIEDYESRISDCEDHEYKLDEISNDIEEMKNLSESTEEAIDELRNLNAIDFPEEFTKALAQPEFITLIETIIKNEREKGKKKKPKTTTTKKKA
jgi:hypothetical protein